MSQQIFVKNLFSIQLKASVAPKAFFRGPKMLFVCQNNLPPGSKKLQRIKINFIRRRRIPMKTNNRHLSLSSRIRNGKKINEKLPEPPKPKPNLSTSEIVFQREALSSFAIEPASIKNTDLFLSEIRLSCSFSSVGFPPVTGMLKNSVLDLFSSIEEVLTL